MARGVLYLLAILGTAVAASGYVLGGLLAGATGLSSVLLAASIPMAALAWAITVSGLERDRHGGSRLEPWPEESARRDGTGNDAS